MSVHLVKIDLLGSSFTVQTDETREYFETLLGELSRRIEALRGSTRVDDPLKLSILASITILDELVHLRGQSGDSEDLARRAERLIARLDAGLEGLGRDGG